MGKQEEIWKDVVGYEGYYMVSSYGRVRSLDRNVNSKPGVKRPIKGALMNFFISNTGYNRVLLSGNNKKRMQASVHRLVATAFLPNPENKPQVNHIDFNKLNNCVDNLNWMTHKENVYHSRDKYTEVGKRNMKLLQSRGNSHKSIPVIMMDMNGNYLREYPSMKKANIAVSGKDTCSIGQHIRHPEKYGSAYGYTWKLKNAQ